MQKSPKTWANIAGKASSAKDLSTQANRVQNSQANQASVTNGTSPKQHSHELNHDTMQKPHVPSSKMTEEQLRQMRHRDETDHGNPLVVSLRFSEPAFHHLTKIRKENFPDKHNNLDAHLTILHALPSLQRDRAHAFLSDLSARTRNFNLSLGALRARPKIVLLPVRSKILDELVYAMQDHFWDTLSDQDRQDFHGHITLCNKQTPEETAKRQASIEDAVKNRNSWNCKAIGIDLWEYRGSRPWKLISKHDFMG